MKKKFKLKVVPLKTWGATKIFAWEQCPLRTQLRYAQHLCPMCFVGRVAHDGPCDKCRKTPVVSAALTRGRVLDNALALHVRGTPLAEKLPHPKVRKLVAEVAGDYAAMSPKVDRRVMLKYSISLDSDWNLLPKFTRGPWFWGELDALILHHRGEQATVLDWKSGGIDRNTGAVRVDKNYPDQLEIYSLAVLCAFPKVLQVNSSLVFLDAAPPHDPMVSQPAVFRSQIDKLKKQWSGRILPMMSDDVFAPRPGDPYCGWCDYSRDKGGPCPVA